MSKQTSRARPPGGVTLALNRAIARHPPPNLYVCFAFVLWSELYARDLAPGCVYPTLSVKIGQAASYRFFPVFSPPTMSITLDALPIEILEEILIVSDPIEVGMVSCCSRFFYNLVYNSSGNSSQHLWRALYLAQPFDDPTICVSQTGRPRIGEFDWKSELQAIIRARTVLCDVSICKPLERIQVLRTLLHMVCWVPPLRSYNDIIGNTSQNLLWVAAVTRGGIFLDSDKIGLSSDDPVLAEEEAQLRARLHTIIGITPADNKPPSRLAARAYIYNMRHYNWANEFGPFLPTSTEGNGTGRVNWVHIKHIHHSITMHMLELADDTAFEVVIYPLSFPFTQIIIPEGMDLDQEEDWAGVNGEWTVSFCFVDHSLLLRYNNISDPETGGLRVSLLADPIFQEMFRSMTVRLQVTNVKEDPNHPGRPRIYFLGAVEQSPDGSPTINGYVCMTDDDQIRWHFVSGEQGQAIWSSEGIQTILLVHFGYERFLVGTPSQKPQYSVFEPFKTERC